MRPKSKRRGSRLLGKKEFLNEQEGLTLGSKSVKTGYRKKRNFLEEQQESGFGSGSIVKFGRKQGVCRVRLMRLIQLQLGNYSRGTSNSSELSPDPDITGRKSAPAIESSEQTSKVVPGFSSSTLSGRTFQRHQQSSQKVASVRPEIGMSKRANPSTRLSLPGPNAMYAQSFSNRERIAVRRPLHRFCLEGPLPVKLPISSLDLTPAFFTRALRAKWVLERENRRCEKVKVAEGEGQSGTHSIFPSIAFSEVIESDVSVTEVDARPVDQIHYQSDTYVVDLKYDRTDKKDLSGHEPAKVVVKM